VSSEKAEKGGAKQYLRQLSHRRTAGLRYPRTALERFRNTEREMLVRKPGRGGGGIGGSETVIRSDAASCVIVFEEGSGPGGQIKTAGEGGGLLMETTGGETCDQSPAILKKNSSGNWRPSRDSVWGGRGSKGQQKRKTPAFLCVGGWYACEARQSNLASIRVRTKTLRLKIGGDF